MSKKILPANYLITGQDLSLLPAALNATQLDTMSLLGLAANRWYAIINKQTDEALLPRQSILVRLLMNHPELSPIPKPPSPSDLYEEILTFRPDFDPNHFGLILGMEMQSGVRLLNEPNTTSCNQVMLYIMMECFQKSKTKKEKNSWLDLFIENILDEVESRGIDPDVFWKYGGWTKFADPSKNIPRKTRAHRL